jgi:hypothetical protein
MVARSVVRVAEVAPHAVLDMAAIGAVSTTELALRAIEELGQKRPQWGRISFPRFFIGLAAARGKDGATDGMSPEAAREDAARRYLPNRRGSAIWAAEAAATAAQAAGMDAGSTDAVRTMARATFPALARGIALHRAAVQWYRTGLAGQATALDPLDALVKLGRWEVRGNHLRVEETLCAALLADVRAALDRPVTLYQRDPACLLAVQGAELHSASRFVDLMARDGSPLAVVTTSTRRPEPRTRAVALATSGPRVVLTAGRFHVDVAPVLAVASTVPPDDAAVLDVLRALPAPRQAVGEGPRRAVAATIARLSAGHPAGRRLLLAEALDTQDPRTLLDGAAAAIAALAGIDGGAAPARVLSCMVRDLNDGDAEAAAATLGDRPGAPIPLTDMWVVPAVHGSAAVHPLLRRAVDRALARDLTVRIGRRVLDRAGLHGALADQALRRGDTVGARYHALAVGQVAEVTDALFADFPPRNPRAWLEQLTAITAAPVGDVTGGGEPDEVLFRLAGDDLNRRLVAALHLHTDPLGDPGHRLCATIAARLRVLAGATGPGHVEISNLAAAYEICWRRWNEGDGA